MIAGLALAWAVEPSPDPAVLADQRQAAEQVIASCHQAADHCADRPRVLGEAFLLVAVGSTVLDGRLDHEATAAAWYLLPDGAAAWADLLAPYDPADVPAWLLPAPPIEPLIAPWVLLRGGPRIVGHAGWDVEVDRAPPRPVPQACEAPGTHCRSASCCRGAVRAGGAPPSTSHRCHRSSSW